MTDLERWHEANDRYLGEAVARVRTRLEDLAGDAGGGPEAASAPPEPDRGGWRRRRRAEAPPPATDASAAEPPPGGADEGEQRPAALILQERLQLSAFEREVLLLTAAMEFDTRVAGLCALAHGDPSRPFPTFALAMAALPDPTWDVLSPERPLRRWHLIEIHQRAGEPFTASALRVDERIANYLKGLNYLDDRLAPLCDAVDAPDPGEPLPLSQAAAVGRTLADVRGRPPGSPIVAVQLLGRSPASLRVAAAHAAAGLGLHVLRMPARSLPTETRDLELLARLWWRESLLLPIALYLDGADELAREESPVPRFLALTGGLVLLGVRDAVPELRARTPRSRSRSPAPRSSAPSGPASWAPGRGTCPPGSPASSTSRARRSAVPAGPSRTATTRTPCGTRAGRGRGRGCRPWRSPST